MTDEFDLKKSKEIVGMLYPVLLDAYENVIDGFHRLETDPNWFAHKLEWVKDEETRELVRTHANLQRRIATPEERRESFVKLAGAVAKRGIRRGQIAKEVAKVTGFTDRHVRDFLPDEFKMVEEARESAEPVPPKIECDLLMLLGGLRDLANRRDPEGNCGECGIRKECGSIKRLTEKLGGGGD